MVPSVVGFGAASARTPAGAPCIVNVTGAVKFWRFTMTVYEATSPGFTVLLRTFVLMAKSPGFVVGAEGLAIVVDVDVVAGAFTVSRNTAMRSTEPERPRSTYDEVPPGDEEDVLISSV